MEPLKTEAARERWNVRNAWIALPISLAAVLFSFLQWKTAATARLDTLQLAAQQRTDSQEALRQQRADSDAALKAQTENSARAYKLADRSTKAAEVNAQISRLALQVSERPWIGITAEVSTVPVVDKTGTVHLIFQNTGKTPAFQMHGIASLMLGRAPSDIDAVQFIEKNRNNQLHQSQSVLVPNQFFQMWLETQFTFTEEQLKAYTASTDKLWVIGTWTYVDYFKKSHRIDFCFYSAAPATGMSACDVHNTAD